MGASFFLLVERTEFDLRGLLKAVGKGFDDRQWRKAHRILSQPTGSELHSVESCRVRCVRTVTTVLRCVRDSSRPYRLRPEGESRHFDLPGLCKSWAPGLCFFCGISGFPSLQPAGLQWYGEAPFYPFENFTSGFFHIFRVYGRQRAISPDCRSRALGWRRNYA